MAASSSTIAPLAKTPSGSGQLSLSQLEQVFIANGGNPTWAPTMALTALLESGGNYGPSEINNNPSTGDYSVGPWQINYFGSLAQSRTTQFGAPTAVASNPNLNAKAAVTLLGANGQGISNWPNTGAAIVAANGGQPLTSAQAQQAASGQGSFGTTLTAATSGGANAGTTAGSGSGCSSSGGIDILGAHIGTGCQLKALKGGALTFVGGFLMLAGVALIIAKTGIGKKVAEGTGIAVLADKVSSRSSSTPAPTPSPAEYSGNPNRRGSASHHGTDTTFGGEYDEF